MNDVIADEPEPPPRFPVMTGVAAGLWIVHGGIYSVMESIALTGHGRMSSGPCCCMPFSAVFMILGILTFLGKMHYPELAGFLGFCIGFWEIYFGVVLVNRLPLASAAVIAGGVMMMLAYAFMMYDLDDYNRWKRARSFLSGDEYD